ncbi:MAG: cytochrome c oxidase subunit II, partial [Halieaceae bacterium]|nr:cytochrome c oxidase subunit II [Halieaceae bacterium]
WTLVPLIILVGIAVPATQTLLGARNLENAAIDIRITGYQWKWHYEYLDENGENIKFFSQLSTPRDEINNAEPKGEHYLLEVDEPLVIPVNTRVRLLLTANDVAHAWWVPDLAVKKDAIPGLITEVITLPTSKGTYRGQCAQLCGKDHGFMPIVVNVVSRDEYDQWILAKRGNTVVPPRVHNNKKG